MMVLNFVRLPKLLRFSVSVHFTPKLYVFNNLKQKHTSVEDPIVITDDGSTLVCWHPEKEFPYDCTKPMPDEPVKSSSILKSNRNESLTTFGQKSIENEMIEELAKLTYTCKHRWYPRGNKERRPKKLPKEGGFL